MKFCVVGGHQETVLRVEIDLTVSELWGDRNLPFLADLAIQDHNLAAN